MSTTQDRPRPIRQDADGKLHGKESAREEWRFRALRGVVALFAALLVSFTIPAIASANISFIKAYGWGVLDGANQFETCTTTCSEGYPGAAAGEFQTPNEVATDSSGDVYVSDNENSRIDEFSADGAFIKAYGWGVSDGASKFETCTSTCQAGIAGGGAGQLDVPTGVATNSAGDVYVSDYGNNRIDEFSAAGAFIKAYGWGVSDGANEFETCTSTCQAGHFGYGAGELAHADGVATDGAGDVYVADDQRIDEFSAAGAFMEAYGWGVSDGASKFETCTSTCQAGIADGAAGAFDFPIGVAIDSSGDVYVADLENQRIDEFSSAGAFIEAYGWGVRGDGANQFEVCTSTCSAGRVGDGAGEFDFPENVATDGSGDVYVTDLNNQRVEEFSPTGAFIAGYGWGVSDGANHFETCTSTCQTGIEGGSAGEFNNPYGIASDSAGDLYVADYGNERIDEFGARAQTTTSTSLSGGGQSGASISVPPGTAVVDTASLSGTNASTATGTVTYNVYSDSGCTTAVSSGTAQNITTPGTPPASSPVTLDTPGTYYWQASYSGDSANAASTGTCGSEIETVTSPTATSISTSLSGGGQSGASISVPENTLVSDTASLSGTNASTATGTVTYNVYSDPGCTKFVAGYLDENITTPGTLPGTGSFATNIPGTYYWQASYSGDSANAASTSPCGAETETVTSPPPQYRLTVSKAGSGSGTATSADGGIDCGGRCSDAYASGTVVMLTATPASGSTFAGWSGAGCSGTGTCVVTMSAAQNVTATFNTIPPVTVEIESDKAMVSGGRTNIELACSGGAIGSSCSGTLSLTIRQQVVRIIHHHRTVTFTTVVLAHTSYTLASGKTRPVALKLTSAALGLLSRAPGQRLRVQAAATASGGRTATRTIILQPAPPPPHPKNHERHEHRPSSPTRHVSPRTPFPGAAPSPLTG
ncbi:MAG TPA: hypothetical protein VMF57_10130 [Solirubrobacteraceae bacterium]|nr:hypothetical protein [Solirubrobacteraceae bacterium]